jgi:hypothetical protein
MKKHFKDCVNVNSPEFKALAATVGRNEAELLTRLNNMVIPNKGQAEAMQIKYRNQSYKDLIDYLDTAPFVDEIGLRKRLTQVITNFKGSNYIVTTRNETIKNLSKNTMFNVVVVQTFKTAKSRILIQKTMYFFNH